MSTLYRREWRVKSGGQRETSLIGQELKGDETVKPSRLIESKRTSNVREFIFFAELSALETRKIPIRSFSQTISAVNEPTTRRMFARKIVTRCEARRGRVEPSDPATTYIKAAFVYETSPEQIGFYNYHRWAVDPREFVTNAMTDRVRTGGNFTQVRVYDGRSNVDHILSGRLGKLGKLTIRAESKSGLQSPPR